MKVRTVLLVISGGIAAYKSLELIRELARHGIQVRVILTRAGSEFVTPLSVAALSGTKVHTELFDLTEETEMGHIQLSRSADLIVVCPATADLMARAAQGQAGDLASTALLATDKPVLMVPAMNVRMWQHPATRRNVARLRDDGITVMEPDEGAMACGEFGPGRLPDIARIIRRIEDLLNGQAERPLSGRHAVVTAGPTREPLDPVRYLSNHSSGKQGYAIAGELAHAGARVTLVSGPVALAAPEGVDLVRVETALEMLAACERALPADVFLSVAAVADWRPVSVAGQKLKLKGKKQAPTIELAENPDILKRISRRKKDRPGLVIGFAAETEQVEENAVAKRLRKGCDWIVANDVSGDVMGGDDNEVVLVSDAGAERWPRLPKPEVAARLVGRIAGALTD